MSRLWCAHVSADTLNGIDLHCHSTASDGTLTPKAVVARALEQGVRVLALTDHDSIGGLAEAATAADMSGLKLVKGVEISVTWEGQLFHIIGLGIDPANEALQTGIEMLRRRRDGRGSAMAAGLAALGVPEPLAGARRQQTTNILSRTHFARHLVATGFAATVEEAILQLLVPGKPGYVHVEWATLDEAVGWIRAAGGDAVIAHPGRYRLETQQRERLVDAFMAAGGMGIEVVCGRMADDHIATYSELALRRGLRASLGSDFHEPGTGIEIGRLAALPDALQPVWKARDWAPT